MMIRNIGIVIVALTVAAAPAWAFNPISSAGADWAYEGEQSFVDDPGWGEANDSQFTFSAFVGNSVFPDATIGRSHGDLSMHGSHDGTWANAAGVIQPSDNWTVDIAARTELTLGDGATTQSNFLPATYDMFFINGANNAVNRIAFSLGPAGSDAGTAGTDFVELGIDAPAGRAQVAGLDVESHNLYRLVNVGGTLKVYVNDIAAAVYEGALGSRGFDTREGRFTVGIQPRGDGTLVFDHDIDWIRAVWDEARDEAPGPYIPEPATFGILALGALAGLRRRRH